MYTGSHLLGIDFINIHSYIEDKKSYYSIVWIYYKVKQGIVSDKTSLKIDEYYFNNIVLGEMPQYIK